MENNELRKNRILESKYNSYFDKIASTNEKYLKTKKYFVSDVDGILTESSSYYTKDGKVMKKFGAYDTEMISFMKTQGWEFIFVSKDKNGVEITKKRIEDLGCEFIEANVEERIQVIKKCKQYPYINYVVYAGDSLSDIAVFREADFAATVNNAPDIVKEYCNFIAKHNGGFGGFADICYFLHQNLQSTY